MSSLFDVSCLWNLLPVPPPPPNALHHPTFTHSLAHTLSPSGFSAVRPRAREPAPVFHFAFPKANERGGGQERQRREITRRHSFQFNGRCSMSCFDKEWIWAPILSTISYQQMTYGTVVGAYEGFTSRNVRVSVLGLKHYLELISRLLTLWNTERGTVCLSIVNKW